MLKRKIDSYLEHFYPVASTVLTATTYARYRGGHNIRLTLMFFLLG